MKKKIKKSTDTLAAPATVSRQYAQTYIYQNQLELDEVSYDVKIGAYPEIKLTVHRSAHHSRIMKSTIQ